MILSSSEGVHYKPISPMLQRGLFEAFFDYQYEPWFGPIKSPPVPPPWESASRDALQALLQLAELAKSADISAELKQKVSSTAAEVRTNLTRRR
jgi:hypothetical protein